MFIFQASDSYCVRPFYKSDEKKIYGLGQDWSLVKGISTEKAINAIGCRVLSAEVVDGTWWLGCLNGNVHTDRPPGWDTLQVLAATWIS
jgi:hypothetical protein